MSIDTDKYDVIGPPPVWRIACLDCDAALLFGCYADVEEYSHFHTWECPAEHAAKVPDESSR